MATEQQTRNEQVTEIDSYLTVLEETLPPRGLTSFKMYKGQVLRIVDVEGQQVADLIAFNLHNYEDKLSVHNTLLLNGTLFITTGNALYSTHASRLMTIVEDTCGLHDLIAGSCSEWTNALRYGVRGTPSCRGNLEQAMKPWGIPLKEIPYSFNVFMNVPVSQERVVLEEPISKPGDYIDLRADIDLLIGISNCPQERAPVNAFKLTPLKIVVYEKEPTGKGDVYRGW